MKKSFTSIALTMVFGWLLYSITGTIPMSMDIPLPDALHTNYSSLQTGYTDENALRYNMDKKIIKKKTFDSFDLFKDANAMQNAYYDSDEDLFLVGSDNGTYALAANNPSDSELYENTQGRLALRTNKYQYLLHPGERADPYIGTKRGSVLEAEDWKYAVYTGDSFHMSEARDLLVRQRKEKITPSELSALLQIRFQGILAGWNPETETAIFNLSGYCTQGEGATVTHPDAALSPSVLISDNAIVGYDEARKALVEQRLSDGAQTVLSDGIEQVSVLNVCLRRDKPVLGGVLDSHTAFIYNYENKQLTKMDLGSDFTGERFIFGADDFLITMSDEDGGFSWKRGEF